MTTSEGDQDLRGRFAVLREEDRAVMPRFGLPPLASRPRHWLRWGIASAAAVIGALVVWWVSAARTGPSPLVELSRAVWVAPTDFLLETPGRDLLRRAPQIEVPRVF